MMPAMIYAQPAILILAVLMILLGLAVMLYDDNWLGRR